MYVDLIRTYEHKDVISKRSSAKEIKNPKKRGKLYIPQGGPLHASDTFYHQWRWAKQEREPKRN